MSDFIVLNFGKGFVWQVRERKNHLSIDAFLLKVLLCLASCHSNCCPRAKSPDVYSLQPWPINPIFSMPSNCHVNVWRVSEDGNCSSNKAMGSIQHANDCVNLIFVNSLYAPQNLSYMTKFAT